MRSLWESEVAMPEFESLDGNRKTDVLIIGGGIAGILCAHMLSQRKTSYILVEAKRICSGVTGSTTAKITSQHGLIYDKLIGRFGIEKTEMYLKANENAIDLYRRLCKDIDCDFHEKDNFVYSISDIAKIEKELSALSRLNFNAELSEDLPLPFKTAGAVRFPNQAQFNPLKFLASIAKGLNIYENTKVLELMPKKAVTNRGKITADKIIVTTHFPILNKHGVYFLKQYQSRSYVLALENAPDINGMYVDEADGGLSFRNYSGRLLFGGGSHRTGKDGGGWRSLSRDARRYYPNAKEVCRWATQDCMTLDSIPYIGKYSKSTDGLYVATGFNKWGMTSSMVSAMLLSDIVLGVKNQYLEVFNPSRSILRPQLALNGFEAIAGLVSPAAHRCPHMGCALKWNKQERTWDCPCHGSRFSPEGSLIDNPATDDLKIK